MVEVYIFYYEWNTVGYIVLSCLKCGLLSKWLDFNLCTSVIFKWDMNFYNLNIEVPVKCIFFMFMWQNVDYTILIMFGNSYLMYNYTCWLDVHEVLLQFQKPTIYHLFSS